MSESENTRLIMIQGEEVGREYILGETTTIGRGSFNTIQLRERKASRKHAVIQAIGTEYTLTDLDSGNGTYLNNKLIKKAALKNEDVIQIAEAVFIFKQLSLKKGDSYTELNQDLAIISDNKKTDHPQAELKFDDQRSYLINPQEEMPVEALSKANAKLRTLYYINNAISTIRNLEELLKTILEIVFQEIPAERGVILLYDEEKKKLQSVVTHVRGVIEGDIVISQTIINRVTTERVSILSTDTMSDARFVDSQSIYNQGICSSMSVPLISKENLLGVLYIDTTRLSTHFNEDNLEILTGIASQAAVAIENAMLIKKIERETETRTHLQRYLAPELVEQVVQKKIKLAMGGHLTKSSVLFADIREFTRITESLGSEAIVTILNQYFGRMVDIIFSYGGSLDKFIGDSIMAIWGNPIAKPDDAISSVSAALDMQRELFYFNVQQSASGGIPLHIGIGVNTGEVVSGNMGSPKRMEYTVIGKPVNLASRVETLTLRNQILVSEYTYNEIQDRALTIELEPTMVKGISHKIRVFIVLAIHYDESSLFFLPVKVQINEEHRVEGLIISLNDKQVTFDLPYFSGLNKGDNITFHLDIPNVFDSMPFTAQVDTTSDYVRKDKERLTQAQGTIVGFPPSLNKIFSQSLVPLD